MPTASKGSDAWMRRWLAALIVTTSIVGVVLISIVAIATAGDDRAETSQLVFSAVLPLLGTWVGTVLAFYFARENFQAATESTLALAGIETDTPVSRVMVPDRDFVAYDLGTNEKLEDVDLAAVRDKMAQLEPPRRRLPIRNPTGAVLCVIHDSTLTAFAETQGETTANISKKLGDLLAVPEYEQLVKALGFVGEKATVADARRTMASVKNCNDVFVTAMGKPDDRAVGWLTNTLLAGVE